jgi:hypothetical protein
LENNITHSIKLVYSHNLELADFESILNRYDIYGFRVVYITCKLMKGMKIILSLKLMSKCPLSSFRKRKNKTKQDKTQKPNKIMTATCGVK